MTRSPSDAPSAMTRRGLLSVLTLPLVAAACRRLPYDPSAFVVPERSPVALLPADSYAIDFADLIARGLQTLGVDVRGRRVFLKPNMVEYEPGTSINTHPHVVAGTAIA